jgi:hypothetical protein
METRNNGFIRSRISRIFRIFGLSKGDQWSLLRRPLGGNHGRLDLINLTQNPRNAQKYLFVTALSLKGCQDYRRGCKPPLYQPPTNRVLKARKIFRPSRASVYVGCPIPGANAPVCVLLAPSGLLYLVPFPFSSIFVFSSFFGIT